MEQDAAVACSIAVSAAIIYFYHRQQVKMGRGGIKLLQAFLMLVDEQFGTYLAPFPPTDGQAVGPGAAAADGQQNVAAPAVDGNGNVRAAGEEKKRKSKRSKRSKREKKTEESNAAEKEPEAKVAA